MSVDVKFFCPLGSDCEVVKDGEIHRCTWYTEMRGRNPNTGEETRDWACAMSWMPVLLIENAATNRGQTTALESLRKETTKGQEEFNSLLRGKVPPPRNQENEGIDKDIYGVRLVTKVDEEEDDEK